MPNGYSKVTWVEHVEVDERVVHRIYDKLVSSGMSFDAKRWLSTLERQCKHLANMLACSIPTRDLGVISNSEGRRSMLKLAERMMNSF
jgi:homeobox-leucine zipper protein